MGNFSRDTFDRLKHYVGVRLQQGVPLIDADWNEQEDIRKFELQTFLKWFAGNGVPHGNDGFLIVAASGTGNTFDITGGDGTARGAGRCIVEGLDVMIEGNSRYTDQPLYDNATLATQWGVEPIAPLTTPTADRVDTVYLDVWEREVDSGEDTDLINPAIGLETCVRLKREWAVRVAEGALAAPAPAAGHAFYPIARLNRRAGRAAITASQIEDLRTTGINLSALAAEIQDARGMKANLGNRLDESLTRGGQLRHNVVGSDQLNPELTSRIVTLENHLARRMQAQVLFSNNDANNAIRTINTGFRTRFVWIVGSVRALLGDQYYGTTVSAYADLHHPLIQQCTGTQIIRASADNWWQSTSVNPYICKATFINQTTPTQNTGNLNVIISAVSATSLTVRFSRILPGTSTGTGSTGTGSTGTGSTGTGSTGTGSTGTGSTGTGSTGTGSTGTGSTGTGSTGTEVTTPQSTFRIELQLLCLG